MDPERRSPLFEMQRPLALFFVWLVGDARQVHAVAADVRKEQEIAAAFDFMEKTTGLPDIVINNAYVTHILLFSLLRFSLGYQVATACVSMCACP